ncbi:hypothetical protein QQJ69_19020 [Proteus mirabilis]|uniref:hypothetical protein n=1 Tax=Proteus mirabilis TaxID=584 RepID=UPI0025529754|nr:hypothetical protein [Proteus mirabilis]MDL2105228.1 hypothetical protein [Proteus mirabilis]
MFNGRVIKKIFILSFCCFVSIKALAGDAMNAEFRTLPECLAAIQKNSGESLKIVTDKPNVVSGFLSNGQPFGCERKESGTKGIYFHGWYYIN